MRTRHTAAAEEADTSSPATATTAMTTTASLSRRKRTLWGSDGSDDSGGVVMVSSVAVMAAGAVGLAVCVLQTAGGLCLAIMLMGATGVTANTQNDKDGAYCSYEPSTGLNYIPGAP